MFRLRFLQALAVGIALLSLLLAGCALPLTDADEGPPQGPTATPDQPVTHGTADVEEVDILIMESFPVQVAVVDEIRRSFDAETNTFFVEITTVRPTDAICTQALEPFEERISLDVYGRPAGTYAVDVNGVTDTFTLDVDNAPQETPSADISWDEAKELILSGDVQQVTQLHSRQVTLHLEDGRRLVTVEPHIDAVFDVVEECGEPCADMVLATE
jgi:inhibitor of cysteine peptidase